MTVLPEPRYPFPSDAPPYRWGILAPGAIARNFVYALRQHTRQSVVAVASRSRARAAQFAKEFGIERVHDSYEDLVADPSVDVVYIASTHNTHEELALLAIAAGKAVLVEKPLATTAEGAQRIADAAREAGVFAMEAMWTRYLPHTDVVRQLLADGALGEVKIVAADFGAAVPFDPANRLFDPATAGGALLDLGVYPVSFAQLALPSLIVSAEVHAFGSLARTGVDQLTSMVIETDGEAHAIVSTNLLVDTPSTAWIAGTAGRIDVHSAFWAPTSLTWRPKGGDAVDYSTPSWTHGKHGMSFEAAACARYLASGLLESPLHPLNESIATLRILDEARRQLELAAN